MNKAEFNSKVLTAEFCSFLPTLKKSLQPLKKETKSPPQEDFVVNVSPKERKIVEKRLEVKKKESSSYNTNDIFEIDEKIKDSLKAKKEDIEQLERKRKRLEWIKNNAVNKIEVQKARDEIFHLQKKITSIETNNKLKEYIHRTSSILKEIQDITSNSNNCSFVGNNKEELTERKRRNELLHLFYTVASKFTYIDLSFLPSKESNKGVCEECNYDQFDMTEDGKKTCLNCSHTTQVIEAELSYKDTERINLIPRYNYSKDQHFRDAMNKFEGLQNKTIPREVYTCIYEEIDRYDIYTKETITKTAIYCILQKNGYSDYYEDINLIHSVITGIPPPSISSYRQKLLHLNKMFEKTYDEVKEILGKNNALNANHKLMRFLGYLGYPAKEEDLLGLKTSTKKKEHDHDMKLTFKRMKLKPNW